VRILLDENIPLALERRLLEEGFTAEHVITLGRRGASDAELRAGLERDDLLFLTQDVEFLVRGDGLKGRVLVSRVRQSRPLAERLELWLAALRALREAPSTERLFELLDSGELVPFQA
jgi:predicted nuclease of predicted toxin-antitoxin system